MPKRMSLVNTIRLGRTWLDLASHGDITAFEEPYYPPVKPARPQEVRSGSQPPLAAYR